MSNSALRKFKIKPKPGKKESLNLKSSGDSHRPKQSDSAQSIEQRIQEVITQYKKERGVKKNYQSVVVFSLMIIVILAIGYFGFKVLGQLKEKGRPTKADNSFESSSSQRILDWTEFESEVQKKRLESDLEFEKLKNGEGSNGESGEQNSESSDDSPTSFYSSNELNLIRNTLSALQTEIDGVETENFDQPETFTF